MARRLSILQKHTVPPNRTEDGESTRNGSGEPPALPPLRALQYVLHSRRDQVGSCLVSTLCELAYCKASGFQALLPAKQSFDNASGKGGIPLDFPLYRALREVVPRCEDETGLILGYKTLSDAGAALIGSCKMDVVTAYGRFLHMELAGRLPLSRGEYICLHVRLGDVAQSWPADHTYDRTFKYVAHWMTDLARDPLSRTAYTGYQDELSKTRFGRCPWGQVTMNTEAIVTLVGGIKRRHVGLPVMIVGLVPEAHVLRSALPGAHFATGGSEWDDIMLLAGAKVLCIAHSYLGFVGALLADPAHTSVYYPMNAMYSCLGLGTVVDRSGWDTVDSGGVVVDNSDWQLWRR
jgi:hypothetical protein